MTGASPVMPKNANRHLKKDACLFYRKTRFEIALFSAQIRDGDREQNLRREAMQRVEERDTVPLSHVRLW